MIMGMRILGYSRALLRKSRAKICEYQPLTRTKNSKMGWLHCVEAAWGAFPPHIPRTRILIIFVRGIENAWMSHRKG